MTISFDPSAYVEPRRLNVPRGMALSQAIVSAVPEPQTVEEKRALSHLVADLEKLERIWRERQLLEATEDRRSADRAVESAWAALQERLAAYARLPVDKHPQATRAQEILDILFPTPEGLSFLKLPYEAEWAESDLRLGTIDKKDLAKDIDVLAGSEFLVEVRRAQETYGQVLGITEPKPAAAQAESLREPLLTLGRGPCRSTASRCWPRWTGATTPPSKTVKGHGHELRVHFEMLRAVLSCLNGRPD